MTSTDTKQAILQAIIDEPHEDLHRLAYADFLEEAGNQSDLDRAKFIRLSLDAHNYFHNHKDWVYGECCLSTCKKCDVECQRAFLWESNHEAADELGEAITPWWPNRKGWFASITGLPKRDTVNTDYGMWFSCHRGMVDAVATNQRRWKKHGPRLVKEHPIAYVQFQGIVPALFVEAKYWYWVRSTFKGRHCVQSHFFDLMPQDEYCSEHFWKAATEATCLDALSDAALLWAKSQ